MRKTSVNEIGHRRFIISVCAVIDEKSKLISGLFTSPDMAAERLHIAAAAEIVNAASYEVICKAVACIKMCCIGLVVRIDSNEYTLTVEISLQNTLLVCKHRNLYITVAQSL